MTTKALGGVLLKLGNSVCRDVRQMPDYMPIIIISAKGAETHRVLGLELGADD